MYKIQPIKNAKGMISLRTSLKSIPLTALYRHLTRGIVII
jgi:hypothetical protein